ncbi:MAG TPA: glycosyltransferase [Bacteroidales bacterium]|nr:glycosyltransferase [Bacteroidales bacterium]
MTFSIVIPAYNGSKYIEKTILSALGQNRKADEIIVHDDNSSDTTSQICKKYSNEISYQYNPDGPSGFVNGWNKAIKLSSSDFISVLHQDDILYPEFLEKAEQVLLINPQIRHLFSLCEYIDAEENTIISNKVIKKLDYVQNQFIVYKGLDYVKAYQKKYGLAPHIHRCPGVLTHRTIFEEGCWYNPMAGHIADDDFFYRAGQFTDVIGIMKPLAAYRHHIESETGKTDDILLSKRLSADYLYQLKQWKNSNFIDRDALSYFERNALKFLKRFSAYAFKKKDAQLKKDASILFNNIEQYDLFNKYPCTTMKLLIIQLLNKI